MAHKLSAAKAKTILKDKEVRGHPLTTKQKRFFGFIAGGGNPTKVKRSKKVKAGKKTIYG